MTVTGSGDYDGSGLVSEQAEVEADGSGSVKVDVSGRLSATSTGSGDITYTGNPTQVDKNSSGSGEITAG